MKLNPQQEMAVKHVDGPALVLAGAGSGKTRVIVNRIASLIANANVFPWNILAITFTNKAANEMRLRVEAILDKKSGGSVTIGTFHSVCARILRFEHKAMQMSANFSIADETDQITRIKKALNETGYNPETITPKMIAAGISRAKNIFETPGTLREKAGYNPFQRVLADVYEVYQKDLKADSSLDFDDLIVETAKLFQNEPSILSRYQDKFKHIMIDEYQDTNNAQYVFIKLLSQRYRNVMAVGDDDQSIYQWRGAEISNIINFQDDFPGAKIIKLEQNYRSTKVILAAASALMHHNINRNPKTLWTENKGGDLIQSLTLPDDRSEAAAVCSYIAERVRYDRAEYKDFAVLYRVNAQSRILEEVFQNRKIPYRVIGNISFFKRKEIKDLLAYIRLILNPGDSVSCKRIINTPRRGIGKTTIQKLELMAQTHQTDFCSAINIALGESQNSDVKLSVLETFVNMIDELRQFGKYHLADAFIHKLLELTGYKRMFQQTDSPESRASLDIIEEFENTVAEFVVRSDGSLGEFADYLALYSDTEDGDVSGENNQVQLMTLHNAKGLEFPCVIITGLEEELCPLIRNNQALSVESLEEERRLVYVGMTRAQTELHLYSAGKRFLYGRELYRQPSRFLKEIPSEYIRSGHGQSFPPARQGNLQIRQSGFATDERVLHATWGRGTVLQCTGSGLDAKIVIRFDSGIKKKLLAGPANLIRLNRNR